MVKGKGNEIHLNEATMQLAVQEYLNKRLTGVSLKVTYIDTDYDDVDSPYRVVIEEAK